MDPNRSRSEGQRKTIKRKIKKNINENGEVVRTRRILNTHDDQLQQSIRGPVQEDAREEPIYEPGKFIDSTRSLEILRTSLSSSLVNQLAGTPVRATLPALGSHVSNGYGTPLSIRDLRTSEINIPKDIHHDLLKEAVGQEDENHVGNERVLKEDPSDEEDSGLNEYEDVDPDNFVQFKEKGIYDHYPEPLKTLLIEGPEEVGPYLLRNPVLMDYGRTEHETWRYFERIESQNENVKLFNQQNEDRDKIYKEGPQTIGQITDDLIKYTDSLLQLNNSPNAQPIHNPWVKVPHSSLKQHLFLPHLFLLKPTKHDVSKLMEDFSKVSPSKFVLGEENPSVNFIWPKAPNPDQNMALIGFQPEEEKEWVKDPLDLYHDIVEDALISNLPSTINFLYNRINTNKHEMVLFDPKKSRSEDLKSAKLKLSDLHAIVTNDPPIIYDSEEEGKRSRINAAFEIFPIVNRLIEHVSEASLGKLITAHPIYAWSTLFNNMTEKIDPKKKQAIEDGLELEKIVSRAADLSVHISHIIQNTAPDRPHTHERLYLFDEKAPIFIRDTKMVPVVDFSDALTALKHFNNGTISDADNPDHLPVESFTDIIKNYFVLDDEPEDIEQEPVDVVQEDVYVPPEDAQETDSSSENEGSTISFDSVHGTTREEFIKLVREKIPNIENLLPADQASLEDAFQQRKTLYMTSLGNFLERHGFGAPESDEEFIKALVEITNKNDNQIREFTEKVQSIIKERDTVLHNLGVRERELANKERVLEEFQAVEERLTNQNNDLTEQIRVAQEAVHNTAIQNTELHSTLERIRKEAEENETRLQQRLNALGERDNALRQDIQNKLVEAQEINAASQRLVTATRKALNRDKIDFNPILLMIARLRDRVPAVDQDDNGPGVNELRLQVERLEEELNNVKQRNQELEPMVAQNNRYGDIIALHRFEIGSLRDKLKTEVLENEKLHETVKELEQEQDQLRNHNKEARRRLRLRTVQNNVIKRKLDQETEVREQLEFALGDLLDQRAVLKERIQVGQNDIERYQQQVIELREHDNVTEEQRAEAEAALAQANAQNNANQSQLRDQDEKITMLRAKLTLLKNRKNLQKTRYENLRIDLQTKNAELVDLVKKLTRDLEHVYPDALEQVRRTHWEKIQHAKNINENAEAYQRKVRMEGEDIFGQLMRQKAVNKEELEQQHAINQVEIAQEREAMIAREQAVLTINNQLEARLQNILDANANLTQQLETAKNDEEKLNLAKQISDNMVQGLQGTVQELRDNIDKNAQNYRAYEADAYTLIQSLQKEVEELKKTNQKLILENDQNEEWIRRKVVEAELDALKKRNAAELNASLDTAKRKHDLEETGLKHNFSMQLKEKDLESQRQKDAHELEKRRLDQEHNIKLQELKSGYEQDLAKLKADLAAEYEEKAKQADHKRKAERDQWNEERKTEQAERDARIKNERLALEEQLKQEYLEKETERKEQYQRQLKELAQEHAKEMEILRAELAETKANNARNFTAQRLQWEAQQHEESKQKDYRRQVGKLGLETELQRGDREHRENVSLRRGEILGDRAVKAKAVRNAEMFRLVAKLAGAQNDEVRGVATTLFAQILTNMSKMSDEELKASNVDEIINMYEGGEIDRIIAALSVPKRNVDDVLSKRITDLENTTRSFINMLSQRTAHVGGAQAYHPPRRVFVDRNNNASLHPRGKKVKLRRPSPKKARSRSPARKVRK